MTAIATAGAGKAKNKHATLQVVSKRLLNKLRRHVMIALPVKLIQYRCLGVAGLVCLGWLRFVGKCADLTTQ
jgi:hypothetical protein